MVVKSAETYALTPVNQIETQFDAGQYRFKVRAALVPKAVIPNVTVAQIEPAVFSMSKYDAFVDSIQSDIDAFRKRQAEGVTSEEARYVEIYTRTKNNNLLFSEENLRCLITGSNSNVRVCVNCVNRFQRRNICFGVKQLLLP